MHTGGSIITLFCSDKCRSSEEGDLGELERASGSLEEVGGSEIWRIQTEEGGKEEAQLKESYCCGEGGLSLGQ